MGGEACSDGDGELISGGETNGEGAGAYTGACADIEALL
jgi:hypothetical protein